MKTKNIFLLIAVAFTFTYCTEKIDVDIDNMEYARLVVDGFISNDTTAHTIKLTTTSDYFSAEEMPIVSGATVKVMTNDGETIEYTENGSTGVYQTQPDVFGVIGKSYTLYIDLASEVGQHKHYESTPQELKHVALLDSIGLEFEPDWGEEGYWTVRVYAQEPETEDYYCFRVYKNGVLVTDSIDEYNVEEDELFNGNYTNGIQAGFLDMVEEEERLELGDTVNFEIMGITEDYYHFVMELQSEIWGSDPMFSGPPANISSNINNGALGFFSVYSSNFASTVLTELPD